MKTTAKILRQGYDGKKALVTAAEWMQPVGCEKYGSDNAIWAVEIEE